MSKSQESFTSEAQDQRVTQRALATLWSEVLNTDYLPGPDDNFFALGGDSMAMVMLEARIKEEFAVELPVGAVLEMPTLRELAVFLRVDEGSVSAGS